MPHFTEPEITRLYLPSTEDAEENDKIWVDVRSKLRLGDVIDAVTKENPSLALATLAGIIVDWNLYEVDENKTETEKMVINSDNIRRLNMKDYYFLVNWLDEQTQAQQQGASNAENLVSTGSSKEPETSIPPATFQKISVTTD